MPDDLLHTLLQIVFILVAAKCFGMVARRAGQPQVVGEMLAGVLLGPSLLGHIAPGFFEFLFTSSSPLPLSVLSQIGLILFMFQIGMEFDFKHLKTRANRRIVSSISSAGIVLPAILGILFGWLSHQKFSPDVPLETYLLFMGISLCITAMPVLGRIMMDLNLTRTRLGTLTITSAAIDDVVGWILLALVTTLAKTGFVGASFVLRFLCFIAFLFLTWKLVRPLLARLAFRTSKFDDISNLGLLTAILFLFGIGAEAVGSHAIFGGFWMGVLLHHENTFVTWWRQRISGFVTIFFLPLFFTYTGLRTNIPGLVSLELWSWCLLLVAFAVVGKFGGCWLAAKWAGLTSGESSCIAIMMNTRGMLELVVANIGYDLKIISQPVYTMLVFMALFSTILTAPCLRRWLPGDHPRQNA